jgi:hypothetical protein
MWQPIPFEQLMILIESQLQKCSPVEKDLFLSLKVAPIQWRLDPWGNEGGGFWVVAIKDNIVLWYNDIEDGFNVSKYTKNGVIDEYWCNQDELQLALRYLAIKSI